MKSILLLCTTFVLCFVTCHGGLSFSVPNALTSAGELTLGVWKDVASRLPTPKGLFETSKQLLVGYPWEFVSSSINQICSSALSSQTITPKYSPEIHKMHFQLRTACDKFSFPLLQANDMWTSPAFDPSKKVVILATGWSTTVNETDTIDIMAKAFACRGDVNFVAIDAAKFVDTLYSWSAFNTEDLGMHIANGLKQLVEIVPVENIHLIGHSLGAHIMGSAGRHFHVLTGKSIPRLTGLDPAKPCFNEGENLSGLLRGDAEFIDVIHSNPGVLGKRDPLGDIDFYPGGLAPLPPGCYNIVCAHARSWEYFAETVYPGNEENFIGQRCSSLSTLRESKCLGKGVAMGYGVPTNAKGNYFLEVNSRSPYGLGGNKHRTIANQNCGLCDERKR